VETLKVNDSSHFREPIHLKAQTAAQEIHPTSPHFITSLRKHNLNPTINVFQQQSAQTYNYTYNVHKQAHLTTTMNMPSSIYSDISDIPTLADAGNSAITAHAILLKLETSLAATRDLLDKSLKLCLAVEVERTEMARNPRFQKFINRPLADNKAEYEEMKTFLLHTKHHNQIAGKS
jgi:hypothetical protein